MNDERRPHDEERLDELVRELGADYNLPPRELDEDRREELFGRIQDERRRRSRQRTPAPRPRSRRLQWVAMAAVLLIGVAIGRWDPSTQPADEPAPEITRAIPDETAPDGANLYRFAARDYLERTENLLVMMQRAAYSPDAPTSFGTETTDPTVGWANDLLRETRMLQDSPATHDDVQLSRLLEDLELLLAQIVQAANRNEQVEADEYQITDPAVLQRLRNEIDRNTSYNEI